MTLNFLFLASLLSVSLATIARYTHDLPDKTFEIGIKHDFIYKFEDLEFDAYKANFNTLKKTPVGC